MKIISKEEANKLNYHRYKKTNLLRGYLGKLKIGESVQIDKKEWLPTSPVSQLIYALGKNSEKKFSRRILEGKVGWVITRII